MSPNNISMRNLYDPDDIFFARALTGLLRPEDRSLRPAFSIKAIFQIGINGKKKAYDETLNGFMRSIYRFLERTFKFLGRGSRSWWNGSGHRMKS
jgi:hypothetical protein